MTMPLKKPGPAVALAQDSDAPMTKHWQQWFDQMLLELHRGVVPPLGIIPANLPAATVTAEFDSDGLGREGGPYQWWAICNGNSHTIGGTTVTTPSLSNKFMSHSNTGAGVTGGSFTSGGTSAANSGSTVVNNTTGAPDDVYTVDPGSTQAVVSSTHTHDVTSDAHTHTIAHTHLVVPPFHRLVWIMRLI